MVVLNIIVMLLLALFVVWLLLNLRARHLLIRIPDGCQESVSIRAIACVGIAWLPLR